MPLFTGMREKSISELTQQYGKTLVCDKRDRAIICMFRRDLLLNITAFWSFTKRSV